MESGRAPACDPSSRKAFDKAAIGISIGVAEDGQVGGKGLVQGGVVAEIGFAKRLGGGGTSVEDRARLQGREKRPMAEWVCLRARSSPELRCEYSSSGGIKCRWMSHRFTPIPVISYLRSAAEGATKGEEWVAGVCQRRVMMYRDQLLITRRRSIKEPIRRVFLRSL